MAELESLLDSARDALLAGDILKLAALADALEAAASPREPAALRRSRDKAARNAALLSAAMKGLRAALRRAEELTQPDRFSTYDSSGRRGALLASTAPVRRV
ncbi:hypothetical protein [Neotabrizicola sp. sgz301269]|uniref:hypothetical protein n=1 Tax=Neotabrizicola sp. sgz301269 TaxID=3276282 RepID=UPI00376F4CE5